MTIINIACELSGKLAAIAPVAGSLSVNDAARCQPQQKISVIHFHGSDDPLVPFTGGAVHGDLGGDVLSATDSLARWANLTIVAARPRSAICPT